jgi:hypothetical protein
MASAAFERFRSSMLALPPRMMPSRPTCSARMNSVPTTAGMTAPWGAAFIAKRRLKTTVAASAARSAAPIRRLYLPNSHCCGA